MVFVTVGYRDGADLVLVLDQIGEIRNDHVHAVHVVLGEAEAAVDDEDVASVFVYGYVLADLVETAKRDYFQFLCLNFCH